MASCDDRLCPLLATLDTARQVIDDLADIHESPDAARGAVAAHRKCAEAVRKCYPCDGPVRSQDGFFICALGRVIGDVLQLATFPVQRPLVAFDPEKLVDGETDKSTGQYL